MTPILLMLAVLAQLEPVRQSQLFLNTDGELDTGYGYRVSAEWMIDVDGQFRQAVTEGCEGWGVPCYAEVYVDGVLTDWCSPRCIWVVTPDLDGDADVDLRDFAAFQLAFTGPR